VARHLVPLLERGRDLGFLGPGPAEGHLDHSWRWATGLGRAPRRGLDLGSGAGVPGLVFALVWPSAEMTLLDARARRTAWLEAAVAELGLGGRVEVVTGRAEDLARGSRREAFDLVAARGFGPPAATAECGTGFLVVGGRLTVSEPPDAGEERWSPGPLAMLGLRLTDYVREGATFVILRKDTPTDARWPRRDGVPHRKPLW